MREPRTYTVYLPGSHRLTSRSEQAVLKRDYDALAAENARMLTVLRDAGWLLPTERPSDEWLAAYERANPPEEPRP